MTPQPEYHDWPTKAEVVQALKGTLTLRTLERKIEKGELRTALRPVPGRRPLVLINPDDVAAMAGERRAALVPVGSVNMDTPDSLARRFFAQFSDGALATVAASTPGRVDLKTKIYLTMKEAMEFTGLTKTVLMDGIQRGAIVAIKSGGWRLRRESLERF